MMIQFFNQCRQSDSYTFFFLIFLFYDPGLFPMERFNNRDPILLRFTLCYIPLLGSAVFIRSLCFSFLPLIVPSPWETWWLFFLGEYFCFIFSGLLLRPSAKILRVWFPCFPSFGYWDSLSQIWICSIFRAGLFSQIQFYIFAISHFWGPICLAPF